MIAATPSIAMNIAVPSTLFFLTRPEVIAVCLGSDVHVCTASKASLFRCSAYVGSYTGVEQYQSSRANDRSKEQRASAWALTDNHPSAATLLATREWAFLGTSLY